MHCIRRSACYDAFQLRAKAGAGLRVQYGYSDERVFRLIGLIDSIPTIDIVSRADTFRIIFDSFSLKSKAIQPEFVVCGGKFWMKHVEMKSFLM